MKWEAVSNRDERVRKRQVSIKERPRREHAATAEGVWYYISAQSQGKRKSKAQRELFLKFLAELSPPSTTSFRMPRTQKDVVVKGKQYFFRPCCDVGADALIPNTLCGMIGRIRLRNLFQHSPHHESSHPLMTRNRVRVS